MTFWLRILAYVLAFLAGRSLNVWQVSTHGGVMPFSFPFGDWIPIAQRWLFSIGDVLQFTGIAAIILVTLMRLMDERYVRMGAK